MKKRIALFYNSLDFRKIVEREIQYEKLINELQAEGKVLEQKDNYMAIFDDGTRIFKFQFPRMRSLGFRFTHIYVQSNILNMENGQEFVDEVLKPTLVFDTYDEIRLTENISERLLFFGEK